MAGVLKYVEKDIMEAIKIIAQVDNVASTFLRAILIEFIIAASKIKDRIKTAETISKFIRLA